MTIYNDAHLASTEQGQSLFGRLAAILATVTALAVATDTTLSHIDSAIERSIKIGSHIKSGLEQIEKWKPQPPQIEYKPNTAPTIIDV